MADHPKSNVAELRLTSTVALSRIREIASESGNVIIGNHARERMRERDIVATDVFRVLRSGLLEGIPEKTDQDEWKCKLILKIRGGRTAGVVTVILHNGKLFVKTVEWEDL